MYVYTFFMTSSLWLSAKQGRCQPYRQVRKGIHFCSTACQMSAPATGLLQAGPATGRIYFLQQLHQGCRTGCQLLSQGHAGP